MAALPASRGMVGNRSHQGVGCGQSGGSGSPNSPGFRRALPLGLDGGWLACRRRITPTRPLGSTTQWPAAAPHRAARYPKVPARPTRTRRREAVNVPVAAVRAPNGDHHRAGIVPVLKAVEHHCGVGGSYCHKDRALPKMVTFGMSLLLPRLGVPQ